MTREHVTVSLSGDAGDELFCGYNSYKDIRKGLNVAQSKLGFIKEPLRTPLGRQILKANYIYSPFIQKVGRCLSEQTHEEYYRHIIDDDVRAQKLCRRIGQSPYPTPNDVYQDGFLDGIESNLMLINMMQYLPDDILVKVDRSGMYYSLETRIPLLDAEVVQFAWSLPDSYKMDEGITKKPLRHLLYRYVPRELMERPKKGFSVPVSLWLQDGAMREWAESILLDASKKASDYIDIKTVQAVWKDYTDNRHWSKLIWHILMFEQWLLQE